MKHLAIWPPIVAKGKKHLSCGRKNMSACELSAAITISRIFILFPGTGNACGIIFSGNPGCTEKWGQWSCLYGYADWIGGRLSTRTRNNHSCQTCQNRSSQWSEWKPRILSQPPPQGSTSGHTSRAPHSLVSWYLLPAEDQPKAGCGTTLWLTPQTRFQDQDFWCDLTCFEWFKLRILTRSTQHSID